MKDLNPGPWKVGPNDMIVSQKFPDMLIARSYKKDYTKLIAELPAMYNAIKQTVHNVGPDHDQDDHYVTIMKSDFIKLQEAIKNI